MGKGVMGSKYLMTILALVAFWVAYKVGRVLMPPPIPSLDENAYWGSGNPTPDDPAVKPFKIQISDKVLGDLNHRLDTTRDLTPPLEGTNFEYGFNTNTLKKLLTFWRRDYKWRDRESYLNQYSHYKTQIQGLDIHFVHIKPSNLSKPRTLPLLLLHGWPSSFREFYPIIPTLTQKTHHNADFSFEVIVPSLPGYGFSQGASKPGLGPVEIAVVLKNLMKRLGYDKFYVHGGDWGGIIANILSTVYPENVLGHHSTFCGFLTNQSYLKLVLGSFIPSLIVSGEYQEKIYPLSNVFNFLLEESGYLHLQASKPDTIGVGLNDSPAGLAAYILEKFSTWTNPSWKSAPDGGLLKKFTFTDLLDNVMIYWISGSATSSMRLYSEGFNKRSIDMDIYSIPTNVPTVCTKVRHDLIYFPDSLIRDKYHSLVHTEDLDKGGHFATMEIPEVLAKEIWMAFIRIETFRNNNSYKKYRPFDDIN